MEPNSLYQFSLLNALMDGVCETGVPVSKFLQKGNHGLGTFVRMNGELIALDGKVYQLQGDGGVREAGDDEQIPFGVISNFSPQALKMVSIPDKTALDQILDDYNNKTANLFMTYRIEGRFKSLKCRTVKGQEYKGQKLSELASKQSVHDYDDVEGTIVGFRSPVSWQGLAVAGQHLHFIDHDRSIGGHVLEISAHDVSMGIAVASNVHVELPTSEDFNAATLLVDDAGIRRVEG